MHPNVDPQRGDLPVRRLLGELLKLQLRRGDFLGVPTDFRDAERGGNVIWGESGGRCPEQSLRDPAVAKVTCLFVADPFAISVHLWAGPSVLPKRGVFLGEGMHLRPLLGDSGGSCGTEFKELIGSSFGESFMVFLWGGQKSDFLDADRGSELRSGMESHNA